MVLVFIFPKKSDREYILFPFLVQSKFKISDLVGMILSIFTRRRFME